MHVLLNYRLAFRILASLLLDLDKVAARIKAVRRGSFSKCPNLIFLIGYFYLIIHYYFIIKFVKMKKKCDENYLFAISISKASCSFCVHYRLYNRFYLNSSVGSVGNTY